eukprot:TRINITY_DN216_c0_g2_i1.p1 TRINITY_DN216_c0_g2~~TRINITY_DN216_c0_g2_i1.p1  ORF type:complete len:593 (-),score=58.51 TRINITY_DN216_c0_g2_i1:85-1863(-)
MCSSQITIVSLCFFLCITSSSSSASFDRILHYNSQYRFSNVARPSAANVSNLYYLLWWTPDAVVDTKTGDMIYSRNVLSLAVMSVLPGYIGIGFNFDNQVDMFGVGVIGVPETGVSLYSLTEGYAVPMPFSFNFSSVETLDGHTTMEIVWDLKVPNGVLDFSDSLQNLTVIYSSSSKKDTTLMHDWADGLFQFDLKLGTKAKPLSNDQLCDCSILQIPNSANMSQCPCFCPGSTVPPTCSNITLPYHVSMYDGEFLLSTVHWHVNGNMASFDVQSNSMAMWFAIGFANSGEGKMDGTQAIIYTPPSEQGVITKNILGVGPRGLISGCALNISVTQVWTLQNGYPGFHFSAPLSEFGNPTEVFLVAVSSPNTKYGTLPHKYHTHSAYVINLLNGQVILPSFVWTTKATHGLLMYMAWVIIFPIGFLWARYAKSLPQAMWFEGHRIIMTVGFAFALVSTCIAFGMVSGHFQTVWHGQVGLAALVVGLFQVCSGILRPHLDINKPKTCQRLVFEFFHHVLGRIGFPLSWAAAYGGLSILSFVPTFLLYIHIVVCILWIFIHIGLEIRIYSKRRSKVGYDRLSTNSRPSSYLYRQK